ncbi:MAG: nucleoside triphosphate pyrophosphohydrolase [PVC group bacterium]
MEKLVRDRIPEIVTADRGREAPFRTASRTEYLSFLMEKLKEEVAEFLESREPAELADIMEVVYHLAGEAGISPRQLEKLRARKAEERGGFGERKVMDF